jgi:nitrate reductase beta subunit
MNVRAQVSMVFHLDKCLGCHTCSIACKNLWTDRSGVEYQWWNNVETKPGTGYPSSWENQDAYKGGWVRTGSSLKLRATDKLRGYTNIFFQPHLPTIDDYYEPWTYKYDDLFNAPPVDTQPTARPISLITGEHLDTIEAGPNWDDDMSGTEFYARKDPGVLKLDASEQKAIFEFERIAFFYLPRICNHCLNPACVASCPSGALYKRGEDGIVLINQEVCRGWRFCVSACPFKKSYYNWKTGKSEKCILCYPRLETGQPQACFHSCVGRIRYLGALLYDADKIATTPLSEDKDLVMKQKEMILNPYDQDVIKAAVDNGVHYSIIESAQVSPVYKFVKDWEIALPLHAEFRTLPMLFYVPPLLPVMATKKGSTYDVDNTEFFTSLDKMRLPMKYFASLFAAGNEELVLRAMKRMMAVKYYRRAKEVGDLEKSKMMDALSQAGINEKTAEEIFRMTSLPTYNDRFVVPPLHREYTADHNGDTDTYMGQAYAYKAATGFGFRRGVKRGL